MTDRLTLQLNDAQAGHKALMYAWTQYAKPRLMAGHKLQLQIKPARRSLPQNAALHAAISDIARQVDWPRGSGQMHDGEVWKRLLVASWCRVQGEQVTVLPALDGHGVDMVPRRTSKLTKHECSDLLEYVHAWGADQGVEFTAPEFEA